MMNPPGISRRRAVQGALMAAVGAATPASLLAQKRKLAQARGDRYVVAELKGGNLLAIDTEQRDRAYLLRKSATPDGQYALKSGGALVVRKSRVVKGGVKKPMVIPKPAPKPVVRKPAKPETTKPKTTKPGTIVVKKRPTSAARGQLLRVAVEQKGRTSTRQLAVLKDGRLMLTDSGGATLFAMSPARDSAYALATSGKIVIKGGRLSEVVGTPKAIVVAIPTP